MVIKYIFEPKQLIGKSNQENIVGWIAALHYLAPTSKLNPQGKDYLPEQSNRIFPNIANGAVSLFSYWMSIDVNALHQLVCFLRTLPFGTKNHDLVSCTMQGSSLLPDTEVLGDWHVLYDNQHFPFHSRTNLSRDNRRAQPWHRASLPVPNGA